MAQQLTAAGMRLLLRLHREPQLALYRTALVPRFYLVESGRRTPVNQNMANSLHRNGFIVEVEQTGQHLPHGVDRVSAPYLWGLADKARRMIDNWNRTSDKEGQPMNVEWVQDPQTPPPSAAGAFVPVREPGGQEQWVELATDGGDGVGPADLDFRAGQEWAETQRGPQQ